MKTIRSFLLLSIIALCLIALVISCKEAPKTSETAVEQEMEAVKKMPYDTLSPKGMLLAVREACGGIDKLKSLKDVEFDYHYVSADGKKDVSKERYILNTETSWARYTTNEINVAPDLEGSIVQYYDGETISVYNNGETITDPTIVGTGQFLRQANNMWFNMMFKLSDPGIIYKYQGQEEIDGSTYDRVLVTYDPAVTGKEENDTYILHINPETRLVDCFYFSLPAFGVVEPMLRANLTYTEIDGIQVITRREMLAPSPDGNGMVPMIDQQTKNVKFNNGFTNAQLSMDIQ